MMKGEKTDWWEVDYSDLDGLHGITLHYTTKGSRQHHTKILIIIQFHEFIIFLITAYINLIYKMRSKIVLNDKFQSRKSTKLQGTTINHVLIQDFLGNWSTITRKPPKCCVVVMLYFNWFISLKLWNYRMRKLLYLFISKKTLNFLNTALLKY